jgi:tetratricopeptide (TPR) repeat protein
MQWLYEFGVAIWEWFGDEDHQNRVTAIAAALGVIVTVSGAILGAIWVVLRYLWAKRGKGTAPPPIPGGDLLSMDQHLTILQKREDQLEAKLADAHQEEKDLLQRQIDDLRTQIANPEHSLAEARKRIADLERLLDREANHIGGDRIARAKAALEQGDYSLADDIFAEIEARNELAVQETARAAHGRGEVAEAEVRWQDAYSHYKRASELHATFDHLTAYAHMTWRLAKGAEAVAVQQTLVDWAKSEHDDDSAEYATQLNNLAIVVQAQGRYGEAETLYRQALEIDRATIGEGHPDYAIDLNNLAGVVEDQGRYAEAETLYRQALEIDRATLGEGHPDYAIDLNNLAGVVEDQGRIEEAEGLYRQSSEIERTTIGDQHPDYAIGLGNLAGVLVRLDRAAEARPLLEQALAIFRATLPADHPHIAETERRLAALPED